VDAIFLALIITCDRVWMQSFVTLSAFGCHGLALSAW